MAKTPLRIATGAPTPLYLPLYVFRLHQGFQLQRDYSITISTPQKNENGDKWAAQQLVDGLADYAVCDPTIAEWSPSLRVVGTIVGKMAFWAVARQDISFFKEFERYKNIISYPPGMTGYYLAWMIRSRMPELNRPKVLPVARDDELSYLLKKRSPSVALTANLLLARRFVEDNPDFKISALWTLDPAFSSFMLTGLLARQTDVDQHRSTVKSVVQGLQRAVALVMTDADEAARGLQNEENPIDKDDAQYFVRTVTDNSLYPSALTPELTSWHNVHTVHKDGEPGPRGMRSWIKSDLESNLTFGNCVNGGIAAEVERLTLSLLVRFGKGDLYEDVANTVQAYTAVSIQETTVIGSYCKFEEHRREKLQERVARIKRAVFSSSSEDENFLIWGSSGSGKSFLIEELGRNLESAGLCRFEKINLADRLLKNVDIEEAVARMEKETSPVLCLLDEVDTSAEHYILLFDALRWRMRTGKNIVFVLVGSTTRNVEELAKAISEPANIKGADMINFVPVDSDHRFNIPDYSVWDRLIIFLSKAAVTLKARSVQLAAVEQLALYYVAVTTPNEKARGLARLGEKAANRMGPGEDTLHYNHLFDRTTGDTERFKFHCEHSSTAQKLMGHFVEIKE